MQHNNLNHQQVRQKIKKAALLAALDINIKRMHRSPYRCSRNIMELGLVAFPNKLSEEEQSVLISALINACKEHDALRIKQLFIQSFLL